MFRGPLDLAFTVIRLTVGTLLELADWQLRRLNRR